MAITSSTWDPAQYLGCDVYGATLAIVGLGRIGRAVAKRAAGFDMTVLHGGDVSNTCIRLYQTRV